MVNEFHQKHGDYSPYRISKELGISQHTVTKYLDTEQPVKSDNSKLSKFAGEKIANNILSVNTNQQSILNNILTLYVPSLHFDADLTYSKGSFYRKGNVAEPRYKLDKFPQTEDTIELDNIDDVIGDEALESVVFDLPYIVKTSWVNVASKVMELYKSFDSAEELINTNKAMLELARRKLKRGGIMVVKTQDTCVATSAGAKQLWVSQIVLNHAECLNLAHEDTFILVSKKLMLTKHEKQHRARKNHCYFLVFRK
ncbi:hypothetical protein [Pseudobutyrivibrio sp.]|uniref:hypothetical protein n=1 Tax=Pseudobutyrivibrio sp. TaxID=2014367 RepID=UPI0025F11273|nr:hypothetical protein [Pseudobutyrivibrio sp.]